MTELTKTKTQLPTPANDPYAVYARSVASDTPFLKFIKGEFQYGVDADVLALGTRLVPHMAELRAGYIKWHDGAPIDENMVRVAEGKPIPEREALGDDDDKLWELDPNGVPLDPWQICNTLPMKDIETGEEFVFTTGSRGGIGAIGKLSMSYGRQRYRHDGQLPVIEIGSDPYRHKTYGDVPYPTFKIVAWQSEKDLIAGETDKDELNDAIPY